VDYAALARQFGGSSVEEDEPDYSSLASMRPMVAHTPRAQAMDYAKLAAQHGGVVAEDEDAGGLNEELRTPAIGVDPRMEPESMMNEAQTREVPGDILGGYANYAGMATAPTMMRGGQAILTGAANSRLRPIIAGAAVGAGQAVLTGGDVTRGAVEGALIGAGTGFGAAGRAAKTAASTAATEAAPDAAALLKVARSASVTSAERNAARTALQKMGWVPEAAETAAPAVRKLAPIPNKGNVKPATVYTKPDPVQGPKPLTEMQIVTRGRQEEAAKAAGLDIGEAFGRKSAPIAEGAVRVKPTKELMNALAHRKVTGNASHFGTNPLSAEDRAVLGEAIEKAGPTGRELYKGSINQVPYNKELKIGSEIDFKITSTSSDIRQAGDFVQASPHAEHVIFVFPKQARGFDTTKVGSSPGAYANEKEWLVAGKFRVASKTPGYRHDDARPNVTLVHLEPAGQAGAQVAGRHNALMSFGKQIATQNPKVGEKIWLLLDDAGNPVKGLTPGEAGVAARKGLKTTWVKNLWTN
jgi:hypothetical protein